MSATLVSQGRAASPRTAIIAFSVFLAAWSGFVVVKTGNESFWSGEPMPTAVLLATLACVAGVSAILVVRGLRPVWFGIVAALCVLVFAGAGIAEVLARFAEWPFESSLWVLLMPFAPTGVFVMPFALTAGAVLLVGRRREPGTPVRRSQLLTLGVIVGLCALTVVAGTAMQIAGVWLFAGWTSMGASLTAVVTALIALERVARDPAEGTLLIGVRVCVSFIVLCGSHLTFLSAAQAVFTDAIGIGGALVEMVALPGFVMGALALGILVATFVRARR